MAWQGVARRHIVTSLTDTVETVRDLMTDDSANPRVIQQPVM
jgi:hypothetical protein